MWSSNSVVSSEACAKAIELAEAHASATDGWTTARHFAVPTTDLPVHSSPDLLKWFNATLSESIFPAVAQVTGAASDKLRVIDAFVVRYDASKQKALPLHSDQSEYSGGGTYFAALDIRMFFSSTPHADCAGLRKGCSE